MRFCSNCGAENDADARFCSSCGTLLEAAPAETAAEAPADIAAEAVQEAAPIPAEASAPETVAAAVAAPFAAAAQEAAPAPQPQVYADPAPAPAPQTYAAPQGQPQTYQTDYVPYQEAGDMISAKCRTFGIIGFVLAIISTAFCWLGFLFIPGIVLGFFMLAFGIVGLIFCNISMREGNFKLARVGRVFGIIGIIVSAICWVIGSIITFVALSGGAYYYY